MLTNPSSVSATARDFSQGFNATASYAQLILSACNKDPLPPSINQPLPPRHEATRTIQHYYDNFLALYPLLAEASFYTSLDAVYSRPAIASPFDVFVVRMVLGIAHAGMLEQRGDANYLAAVGHVAAALKLSEQVLRPGSIQSVQAMLLLHEYAMIDPHHFDSWSLIGAASRAMVDIGLHQDPPKGTNISRSKLELRRRVFWCVYAFDRSTSLVQTRAFSFSDDSANVSMPFPPAREPARQRGQLLSASMLKTLDTAPQLFKLRTLQSNWYTELFQSGREPWSDPYPSLWRICQSMKEWWDKLPASTDPHIRSFFELNLLYSYVYILAPSPRVPVIAPFAQALIFEYCIQYSESMKKHVENRIHAAPISFYDAMRAYMTGRQFIEVLWHNQDRLLCGLTPEPPHVPLGSAPPPCMPSRSTDVQTNIARSITCVKQFTESLGLFGVRWGYMSWRDRFQKDSEELLNALNRRSWELQETASSLSGQSRRPVYRHENSVTSDGSFSSEPPLNTPSPYGQQSTYTSPATAPMGVTPTYPPDYYQHTAGYFTQPTLASMQASQAYNQHQTMMTTTAPTQQFAQWSGLDAGGSAHAHSGALHDENIPPSLHPFTGS